MNNLRGINQSLISKFKSSTLSTLLKENPTVTLGCIRNNAIGIYYNSDLVSMVSLDKKEDLICKINSYYLNKESSQGKRVAGKYVRKTPEEIYKSFENIKRKSDIKLTPEKKAQQALVFANNSNPNSKWICVDIEYRQTIKVQKDLSSQFSGRFDIIAISKAKPHRIAIIELKYNKDAMGGKSGVVKHLQDFNIFNNEKCITNLKKEIKIQLSNLYDLGLLKENYEIENEISDFEDNIEFYMICLYDTNISSKGTVGGYLFNEIHPEWDTKRISTNNAEKVLPKNCDILKKVKFLFKKVASPTDLNINDILDFNTYEK